jgi:hypothetical protein
MMGRLAEPFKCFEREFHGVLDEAVNPELPRRDVWRTSLWQWMA